MEQQREGSSRPSAAEPDAAAGSILVCSECGEELAEGARFCESCGAQLSSAGESGTIVPAQDEPRSKFWYLIVLIWVALAVAAFYWVYARAVTL